MSDDEVEFMAGFKSAEIEVRPGTPILVEGQASPQLYTVLGGMGIRFKTLKDGRRQIVNFVMPGDFLGLQPGFDATMGYSVDATTPMTLCVFRRSEFWDLYRAHPERIYDLVWASATEEHFLGEALLTVGQRSAMERIAWALVTLHARAASLDALHDDGWFDFPFRQQDLADTLGLSLVHTNKTLAKLRERDLAQWANGRIGLRDIPALQQIAVMPAYPRFQRRPLI